jgi:hypothetical protein
MNDAEMLAKINDAMVKYLAPDLVYVARELEERLATLLPMPDTKIILVDFDGVINSYKGGWTGADSILDAPLPGAIAWLESLVRNRALDVRIFSARCNDPNAILVMQTWLLYHNFNKSLMPYLRFQPGKPKAHLIIDDRATQFSMNHINHDVLTPQTVEEFCPWYYTHPDWKRK